MLYLLAQPPPELSALNVFRYITFRAGGAVVTALIVAFVLGPWLIDWLRLKQGRGQPIRTDGPQGPLITKQVTPTMGGVLMLLGIAIATLLWADLANSYVWVALLV